MSIRLLIADDNIDIRDHIKSIVNELRDIEVIGEAEDGLTAVSLVQELSPDVVLMDINMPKLSGIDAVDKILRNNAAARIILMSAHRSRDYVPIAFKKTGASGYIPKITINEDLVIALRTVMAGKLFF